MNDIIRFSELEEFIDNPVRTYSSGMYMRLAFSVAINVDADILLIDEILAVGDNAFQTKCFNKLKSLKDQGTTIVIVSHALGQVERLCDRAIWIDEGRIRDDGPARKVCKEYLEKMEESRLERAELEYRMELEEQKKRELEEEKRKKETEQQQKEQKILQERKQKEEEKQKQLLEEKKREEKKRKASCHDIATQCGPDARREGNWKVKFTEVKLLDAKGNERLEFNPGEKIVIKMKYSAEQIGIKLNFIIGITRNDWLYCYGATSKDSTGSYYLSGKNGDVEFTIDSLNLLGGIYFLDVRIRSEVDEVFDNIYSLIQFKVNKEEQREYGLVTMKHSWINKNGEKV